MEKLLTEKQTSRYPSEGGGGKKNLISWKLNIFPQAIEME